jgi:hypothetical protein
MMKSNGSEKGRSGIPFEFRTESNLGIEIETGSLTFHLKISVDHSDTTFQIREQSGR